MLASNNKVYLPVCDRFSPTLPSYLYPTRDTKKISYEQAVDIFSNTRNLSPSENPSSTQPSRFAILKIHTGISDTVASHLYIATQAPHGPPKSSAMKLQVLTSNGRVVSSTATATLPIPQCGNDIPCEGHIMPFFTNKLVGIGPICDSGCTVMFTEHDVTIFLPL